jgi:glycosyl transferase family 25
MHFFCQTSKKYEEKIVNQLLANEWDIAQLGYCALQETQEEPWHTSPFPCKTGTLVDFPEGVLGTQCVAVQGQILDLLIEYLEGLLSRPKGHPDGGPMSIDGAICVFTRRYKIKRLLLNPSLVDQVSSRSDISPNPYDYIPGVNKILLLARRLNITRYYRKIRFWFLSIR